MAKKKTADKQNERSFELCFEELQKIVTRLEDGRLTLGDALQNYEDGIKCLQQCYQALNMAESKIEKLAKLRKDGTFEAEEFKMTRGNKKQAARDETEGTDELF